VISDLSLYSAAPSTRPRGPTTRTVAPAEAVAAHQWVALKHEISYRRPAFLDDIVVADVIAERVNGARAFFTTVIKRGEDVVAEVQSIWCCLDAASLRPARLAKDIVSRFVPQG